jgi:hypothetical protein
MPQKDASGRTVWTTPELVTYLALALAIGGGGGFVAGGGGGFGVKPMSEDDRPPIIVSNGSINFRAKGGHPKENAAKWETKVANRSFKHVQAGGAEILSFLVDTVQSGPNLLTCTDDQGQATVPPPYLGTEVTIAYWSNNDTTVRTATMSVDSKELRVTVPEDAVLEDSDKRIKIRDADNTAGNKKKIQWFKVGLRTCKVNNPGNVNLEVRQLQ